MGTRTLFSVVEMFDKDGRYFMVDWHPDLHALLDELSPNGELTDKIINFAEELLEDESEQTKVETG